MIVAIIPARGGSRRIQKKNIREFHGRPIIAYSIRAALQSGLFDHVIVSSDDPKTRVIARQCGAAAIDREMKYAFDDVGTQAVAADALIQAEVDLNVTGVDFLCCLYATAPMLTPEDLRRGYDAMMATDAYAYVHGWYYWGRAEWFDDIPLEDGVELAKPADRWIDINTEEDWARAEQMYAALHKEDA